MSKGEPISFLAARDAAESFIVEYKGWYHRMEIVGSILRKEPEIRDIDILAIPMLKTSRQRLMFIYGGLRVNVFLTSEESWGAAKLAYTGPKGYVIGWRKIAQRKGFLLNEKGLFKDGKLVASRTEEEIAAAMGKHVKPPELRGK